MDNACLQSEETDIWHKLPGVAVFVLIVVLAIACQLLLFGRTSLFEPRDFGERVNKSLKRADVQSEISKEIVDQIVAAAPLLENSRTELRIATVTAVDSPAFREIVDSQLDDIHAQLFDDTTDEVPLTINGATTLVGDELAEAHPEIRAQLPRLLPIDIRSLPAPRTYSRIADTARDLERAVFLLLGLLIMVCLTRVVFARNRVHAVRVVGWALIVGGGIVWISPRLAGVLALGDFGRDALSRFDDPFVVTLFKPLSDIAIVTAGIGAAMVLAVAGAKETKCLGSPLIGYVASVLRDRFSTTPDAERFVRRMLPVLALGVLLLLVPSLTGRAIAAGAGLLLIAATLRSATFIAHERLERTTERSARDREWKVTGIATAIVLAVGTWAYFVAGETSPVKVPESPLACNGADALCALPIAQVTLPGTHNSMSAASRKWQRAEQPDTMADQLGNGVRALLFDVHQGRSVNGRVYSSDSQFNAIVKGIGNKRVVDGLKAARERNYDEQEPDAPLLPYLCHGICDLGASDAAVELARVRGWMAAHPRNIVVMIVQDEVPRDVALALFRKTHLDESAYTGEIDATQPKLGELIETQKNLLIFAERKGETGTYYRPFTESYEETPYQRPPRDPRSCEPTDRGGDDNPLFLINHWVEVGRLNDSTKDAASVNRYAELKKRVERCVRLRQQKANVIAVNHYDKGDLFRVVNELNGVAATPQGSGN